MDELSAQQASSSYMYKVQSDSQTPTNGPTSTIFPSPSHPYPDRTTAATVSSYPRHVSYTDFIGGIRLFTTDITGNSAQTSSSTTNNIPENQDAGRSNMKKWFDFGQRCKNLVDVFYL